MAPHTRAKHTKNASSTSNKLSHAVLPSQIEHEYEFFGPIGTTILTIVLPLLCYIFAFVCNDISGCPAPSLLSPSTLSLSRLAKEVGWPGWSGLLDFPTVFWTLAYYGFSLVLQAYLPGEEVDGVVLKNGGRLKYKLNTFNSTILTLGLAILGTVVYGPGFSLWTFIWKHYIQLLTANVLIAFGIAGFVYVRSFTVKAGNKELRELAEGGHTGNALYDFFIGRELNPRVIIPYIGEIDLKIWCELRPGLLGYILLNFAFIAHQYQTYGYISDSLLLAVSFQAFYVLDGIWMESAILTTMDITTDGFGFMLAFGDLVWVPFIYTLQARYLAIYPVNLGISGTAGVVAVQALGYYIFRSANNEKNRFRTDPSDPRVAHLKFMETKAGSKLLVSGWWGQSRHPNYMGDWIMAWSYSLPTGIAGYLIKNTVMHPFESMETDSKVPLGVEGAKYFVTQGDARGWGILITYFYILYFTIMIVHRELRDEAKCAKKYGEDWKTYIQTVKWRIIPYVY